MNRGTDMMRCKGMTLLEVLIATAIFATIMVSVGGFLISASTNISIESRITTLEQQATRTLEDIASRIRESRPQHLSATGARELTYLIPVDHDDDGDVFDDRFRIEWGCRRPDNGETIDLLDLSNKDSNSEQTFTQTIRFVALDYVTEQPPELVLDNLEGDATYPRGHLELVYSFGTVDNVSYPELIVPLTPDNVVNLAVNDDEEVENGLVGSYFDGTGFDALKETRIDEQIYFDWGGGTPFASIGNDDFSIRWEGQIKPPSTGAYTFYPTTDDGVRITIDGDPVVEYWQGQGPTERPGYKDLKGETRYDFVMEYFEAGGGAMCELRWEGPGVPKQIIPSAVLFPGEEAERAGEPIFYREGKSVHIEICLVDQSDPEHPVVVKAKTVVSLKNW